MPQTHLLVLIVVLETLWVTLTFCCTTCLAYSSPIAESPDVSGILAEFSGFDLNQDGIAEISSLKPLFMEDGQPDNGAPAKLLLVMVQSRLLRNDSERNSAGGGLATRLKEYRELLARDGWYPVLVDADVYAGELHQDGRSVLAIRRMFQRCRESYPNFGGAVFVGSFPEPTLVRRWAWKHSSRSVTFGDVTYNSKDGPRATWLALNPEMISLRSDVVLCDLDGNWEEIYHQESTGIEVIKLLPNDLKSEKWPSLDEPIVTDRFSVQSRAYVDFFFIDDAQYTIRSNTDGQLTFCGTYEMRVPEVSAADRSDPNPLARPEIMVSRINPLHVAVSQKPENLDESGKPRAVPKSGGSPNGQFVRDPDLELRLLNEYFDRNLAHRKGEMAESGRRVAAMTTDLHTPSKSYFSNTSKQLEGIIEFPKADAVGFVRFLKAPAIVKGVSAHSNASCSVLMKGYTQAELTEETGGGYWNWKASGEQFVPTYSDSAVRDRVHSSLLRTLWENGKLAGAGSCFYVHGGCEAICPSGAGKNPYNATEYASHTQIAESLLFYGNGLALIGRAKVFYDIPTGFDETFGPGHGCFGDVLKGYFDRESQNASLGRSVASRNKAYFWSILGDWTLKLEYPSVEKPEVYSIRPERLARIRKKIGEHDPMVVAALARLVTEAEQLLSAKPVSVTDNDIVPPSGDRHDYMSFGPYWWPDPETADGLPYIRKDGVVNPESGKNGSDRSALGSVVNSVETLALAYHFTNDGKYAEKAVEMLRVFFIAPETRMNPNLKYGQAIPGRTTGRGIGIIDSRGLTRIVDSAGLLAGSKSMTSDTGSALRKWFADYLDWMLTSEQGRDEARQKNNHGTYYDVQAISFALFVGRRELASQIAGSARQNRLETQIRPDGSQPHELRRTKSFSYSAMNLRGMFQLARLAEHVDVDLWHHQSESKVLIRSALEFMLPCLDSGTPWPHQQIGTIDRNSLDFLVDEAADVYGQPRGEAATISQSRMWTGTENLRQLLR